MKKKHKIRQIALVLLITFIMQLIPVNAYAAENVKINNGKGWQDYSIISTSSNALQINGSDISINNGVRSNGDIGINTSIVTIEGNADASQNNIIQGALVSITQQNNDLKKIIVPSFTQSLKEKVNSEAIKLNEDKIYKEENLKIQNDIVTTGSLTYRAKNISGQGYIIADKNITINSTNINLNDKKKLVISSSGGDININSNKAIINGIIYAPKGTVNISGASFELNGRIIADKIIFNGSILKVKGDLTDLELLSVNANQNIDSDNDGMPDTYESDVLISAMLKNHIELHNPQPNEDYDNDGLSNLQEFKLGTNPSSIDTDNDGLNDFDEVNKYFTNANLYDTDEDGMGDGTEIINGLNPLIKDSNENGILDSDEIITQKLIDSKYAAIDIKETLVKPEITVTGKGDYSKKLNVVDAKDNYALNSINSMIGHPFEFTHDKNLSFDSSELKFKISNEVFNKHNINNLRIAYYNTDENKIEMLDTKVDEEEKSIEAKVQHYSFYFVIDEKDYNYDIDILNSNSKIDTGKADVVFTIDTTGSMSGTINNVKNNINALVDQLKVGKVDVRLGLVGYKDITSDGLYSTKDYGWFNNVDDFRMAVNDLTANGGGDWEESAVDGLDVARSKEYRSSVNKYIILITDAPYKEGIASDPNFTMEKEIALLKEENISASVITSSYGKASYEKLYTETNGIVADIYGNFCIVLEPLIKRITEISNKGAWIRLSNGSIVHLDKDPNEGDYSVDTDKDGIPDIVELTKEISTNYSGGRSTTDSNYKSWTFTSNPTQKDTDGDGIVDRSDLSPTTYNITVKSNDSEKIIFNNGDEWEKFGVDIYGFKDQAWYFVDQKLDGDIVVPWDELGKYNAILTRNNEKNFTAEELAISYVIDPNGVRDYLHTRTQSDRNSVFSIVAGRDPLYYKHTLLNGWEKSERTSNEWYDFFTPIYSEADAALTICRNIDFVDFIHDILPQMLMAGAILTGGILAIGEIGILVEGVSIFGLRNAITMYTNGGSGLLNEQIAFNEKLIAGEAPEQIRYVYRALNDIDYKNYVEKNEGLIAKSPEGKWNLKQHILDGSKRISYENDPFISTTIDLDVAKVYNESGKFGIVKIDLTKLKTNYYEGYKIFPQVRSQYLSPSDLDNALIYQRAVWSQEVTVLQEIPRDAIVEFITN